MISRGRDTYGTERSPLFASALDRKTMKIGSFGSIPGVRNGDRSPRGANPQTSAGLYAVLYRLTQVTGEATYTEEADRALEFFFTHCQSPQTGLMAWGEHLYWDFTTEGPAAGRDTHEILGEWAYWGQCYRLAPDACWRFALGLWDHQIADKQTGDFSRHAHWSRHGPGRGADFPRYVGQMIATWADAYQRPENAHRKRRPELPIAIRCLVARMERNMAASESGHLPAGTDSGHRQIAWPRSNLELARCLWEAAPAVDDNLARRMRELALRQDVHFHQLPHEIKSGGGFVATIDSRTGRPRSRAMNRPYTSLWASGYGYGTHADMASCCNARLRQLRDSHPNLAANYRRQILAAADQYVHATLDVDDLHKPGELASVIQLLLSAEELSGEDVYLTRTHAYARQSIALFLSDDLPLPRATNRHDHYETITGSPALMNALLQLHERSKR